jgi:hypothetical protein
MKKEVLIIFVMIMLMHMVSAVEISLSKTSYFPGETLQAQITGNFATLSIQNIKIYQSNQVHETPMISDLTKQEGIYYFYAILPFQEKNYTLKIENSQYVSSGEMKTETITKDFAVLKTNASYLSFNPGFAISNKDFSIKVKSINGNMQLNANLEATGETQTASLIEESEKTLLFSVLDSNVTRTSLKLNDYSVPVFISEKNKIPVVENLELVFNPAKLEASVSPNNDYFFKVLLTNTGNKNLTGISITNDLNAIITPDSINLNAKEYLAINATIPIPERKNISGKITASYGGKKAELPVFFHIAKTPEEVNLTGTSVLETVSCAKSGSICLSNEECSGKTTASLEGPCCIGQCIIKKSSSKTWIYGIILFIFIILGAGYFYLKLKRKQQVKSTDEMLNEKSRRYRERMSGNSEEVSGNLRRV